MPIWRGKTSHDACALIWREAVLIYPRGISAPPLLHRVPSGAWALTLTLNKNMTHPWWWPPRSYLRVLLLLGASDKLEKQYEKKWTFIRSLLSFLPRLKHAHSLSGVPHRPTWTVEEISLFTPLYRVLSPFGRTYLISTTRLSLLHQERRTPWHSTVKFRQNSTWIARTALVFQYSNSAPSLRPGTILIANKGLRDIDALQSMAGRFTESYVAVSPMPPLSLVPLIVTDADVRDAW